MNKLEQPENLKNIKTAERIELDPSQFSVKEEIDEHGNKRTMMSLRLTQKQAQNLSKISQKLSEYSSVTTKITTNQ